MKKLSVLLTVLMLMLLCVSVSAAEDMIVWDFSNADDVAKWVPSKTTNVEVTADGAIISGSGNDINLVFTPAEGEVINLENYAILAIGYEKSTHGGNLQFYHWTVGCDGNPRAETSIKSNNTGSAKFDFSRDASGGANAKWSGQVTKLRLDPFRLEDERSIVIKYVGIFKDNATFATFTTGGSQKPVEVAPGDPGFILNPNKDNAALGISGTNSTFEYVDNYAIMTSLNGPEENEKNVGDPYVAIKSNFDGDKYPWVKIRIRNLSDATQFEMHFASTATEDKVTGATCTHFPITSGDSDFVEYIFNVKDQNLASQQINNTGLTTSAWTGTISTVRLDCMWKAEPSGQMATGSQMYIDYVGFYATEEEAKAHTPEEKPEEPRKNSGKDAPKYIFSETNLDTIAFGGSDVGHEGGVLRVTPVSHDPTISFNLSDEQEFDTAEFPYFAMRYNYDTKVATAGLFFTTSDLPDLSDKSYSPFTVVTTPGWNNVIVNLGDFTTYTKGTWTGICNSFRLDPINGNDTEATLYLDRLGFFRTITDAHKFLSEGVTDFDYSLGATFTGTLQKSIVPAGSLYEGYKKEEFMLSSVKPVGEGKDPVVTYTDNNGNSSVVALGYTTPGGYTTFVANKAGKYTLGYNHKEYTDIAGHWGEQYINFVSDRTLFGGTSPTEFSPEETMTRGMFVTVLGRMHGVDLAKYDGNTGYADVPATEYYAPYIQWAKSLGIMPGISDTEFAPEQPILRETMAAVIANYISAFDYSFKCYDDPIEFNDLAGCDAATAQAIKNAQEAGIINGKGEGRFDPKGISTRAEVATVMQRVIKAVLGVNTATTQYAPEYFTRDAIRIGAWGFNPVFATKEGMTLLRDLGVNIIISGGATTGSTNRDTVLNYADKYGMQVLVNDFSCSKKTMEDNTDLIAHTAAYAHHPSFAGHYFTDEPGTDDFGWIGDLAGFYNKQLPDKMPFVNLLPMYANAAQLKMGAGAAAIEYYDSDPELFRKYCQQWFEDFDVDYICTDIYPLNGKTGVENRATWNTYKDYCESINQIATVARENDAEFWCCIQTWGWTNGKRTPTEGEYRWQCYTMLSYGCTGILLWSLTSSNNDDFPSIFNPETKTVTQPVYDDCAAAMWEMRDLSDTFVQYKNLGAFTVNYSAATPWLRMTGEYKDFNAITDITADQPLLIGCFDKKEGEGSAFTVVNMSDLKLNASATLKFKAQGTVTLYRKAQPTVLTADADGFYSIALESTEGVFVTIG